MPPRLRAHSVAVADPSRAAHHVATAALGDAPRGRPLLLMVASWGAHPGLRPSPWVIDGVLRAVEDGGLQASAARLGEHSSTDALATALAARGVEPLDDHRGTLTLRAPGSRRALRVPRPWAGRNLCLVLPCVHRNHASHPSRASRASRASRTSWHGPLGTALAALAVRWGGVGTRDPVDLAARSVSELFAHVSVVIDASWWAPLSDDDQAAPMLLAPERTLGLRLSSPVSADAAVDPRRVDAWLGRQLGLPLPRDGEAPRLVGPAARTPWPTLPRSPPRGRSLASQAVAALWRRVDQSSGRRGRSGGPRVALPPAVPGPLARLWDEYARGTRPA